MLSPQVSATLTGMPMSHGPTDLTTQAPAEGRVKTASAPPSWKPTVANVWLAATVGSNLAIAQ